MNTENTSDPSRNTSPDPKLKSSQAKADSTQTAAAAHCNGCSAKQPKLFWFWILAYSSVIISGAYHHFNSQLLTNNMDNNLTALSLVIFVCLVFVHIFTDPIESPPLDRTDPEGNREFEKSHRGQRQKWMIFAYGFMLFSLLMTFYPFVIPYESHDGKTPDKYIKTIRERPIALFVGYSVESKDKNSASTQAAPQTVSEPSSSPELPDEEKEPQPNVSKNIAPAEWVINIGGYIEKCEIDPNKSNGIADVCSVNGGLLIPLYFIIIALMGGSISLTRRLPELQKRASLTYVATESQPKLSQHEFRENIIFYIVQFISAPFLAVLAYYLIEPSTTANSVALAFTAGFASESILLIIRSAADKIIPKTDDTAQYGTITGVITLIQTDKVVKPAMKAEVSLIDLPQYSTLTDEQGLYVLSNVPVGVNNIKIVYTGAKEKTDSVRVEHSHAVVKKNVTIEA